ncbi:MULTISPECIES: hypothetical protein [Rhizobium]|uniref:hypothetical protein n=1 Tax=Rhizobium TaxID=379 RepID=UPI001B325CF3|nr:MULTISPECIES: hypothetical protein [Rhizobium]MBX4909046.1 hypothetical protein [Rhizobium bangladeshense]MBX5231852.1 hypothetical protein [Rhizobium sp. NLR4a]MBX5258178.1 hypothetical protein [Rhizobium sp. NLR16b]MBX5264271.1 hypothetical protein [Rhizobium sp. NLR16a]MBX5269983.1 hypothetical protein [Rhizobium sp. NLR17b]
MSLLEAISKNKVAPIAGMGALLLFISLSPLMDETINGFRTIAGFAGFVIIISATALEMWSYLAGINNSKFSRLELIRLARKAARTELSDLREEVEEKVQELTSPFGPDELEKLKNSVIENLSEQTLSKIEAHVSKKEAQQEVEGRDLLLKRAKMSLRTRIKTEIEDLGRRANLNLIIGSSISLIGMGILAYFIYVTNDELKSSSELNVLIRFLARLSLVIVMQVFAYFFLRLYRYSIFEIKYFQNELTNIELWVLAVQVAASGQDKKTNSDILKDLTRVERNFRLKKGETTVALQREEFEARYESAVIGQAERLIEKTAAIFRAKDK